MFTRICLVLIVSLGIVGMSRADSPPIEWPISEGGNGHFYELREGVSSRIVKWNVAFQLAEASSFRGVPGHLATLTSLAEMQFIQRSFTTHDISPSGIFLGGYQDLAAPDYSEPGSGWRWVTGEPWSFTAWGGGEPNDAFGRGSENHVEVQPLSQYRWNDEDQERRFFVEYPVAVPEPSTVLMLGVGTFGAIAMMRRRRRP